MNKLKKTCLIFKLAEEGLPKKEDLVKKTHPKKVGVQETDFSWNESFLSLDVCEWILQDLSKTGFTKIGHVSLANNSLVIFQLIWLIKAKFHFVFNH